MIQTAKVQRFEISVHHPFVLKRLTGLIIPCMSSVYQSMWTRTEVETMVAKLSLGEPFEDRNGAAGHHARGKVIEHELRRHMTNAGMEVPAGKVS